MASSRPSALWAGDRVFFLEDPVSLDAAGVSSEECVEVGLGAAVVVGSDFTDPEDGVASSSDLMGFVGATEKAHAPLCQAAFAAFTQSSSGLPSISAV